MNIQGGDYIEKINETFIIKYLHINAAAKEQPKDRMRFWPTDLLVFLCVWACWGEILKTTTHAGYGIKLPRSLPVHSRMEIIRCCFEQEQKTIYTNPTNLLQSAPSSSIDWLERNVYGSGPAYLETKVDLDVPVEYVSSIEMKGSGAIRIMYPPVFQ
ncbi:hypothetical protein [Paenibacillus eucommiae]|uniref:Uncharacterized protein n=1 Tax=Paenibacillus eucommiae TaxID=1355755 RepID=A0ABS4J9V7_9BACL|nr:hypothetical protein [Paenibacillus eucommiae]MBP1995861.1 hypothetical protein [Paenibacillus eucommiae]